MSLFTRPVIVGLIIYSNCCLLQRSKMCKGGYCISGSSGMVGRGLAADGSWWARQAQGLCRQWGAHGAGNVHA